MAPGGWDGTLAAEEFERAALHLVSAWERCCPDSPQWTWQTSKLSTISEQYVGSPGVHEQHLYTYHVVYNESYRVPMLFLQGRLQDGRPLQWDSVLRDFPVESQHVSHQNRWTFLTQEDHPLLHRPWFALHPCGTSEIMRLVFSDSFLQENKDAVFISEQPQELSGMSAVSEKQAACESLRGSADITISEKSVKWANLEERFASWVEKYVLTWMSFACPAVGLAIPLRLYVESK